MLLNQLSKPMDVYMRIEKLNLLRYLAQQEKEIELLKTTCRVFIDLVNQNMKDLPMNKQLKVFDMLKDTYTILGRYDFKAYVIAMEWNRPVEKRFYQPRMRILEPVVKDLQDLADGVIDIYCLSMPPRVGKTTIGLFYISWIAGRHPEEHIFAVGYVSGLVGTFYNGVMDFIDSPEYRFYDIFPELKGKLGTSAENRTLDLWEDERYKTVTFRSVDGQITGALEASSLLYMDDMCSGIEEAMKIDRLDTLWNKVSVDVMQRRVQNKRTERLAPILAIGTIWSLHDPICRLKKRYRYEGRFRERIMPALDENGESNFDYDYKVGFTTKMYMDLKETMDDVSWECVFQQNPIERDGLLFAESSLKYYLKTPDREPDAILAFCDVAFGGNDYLSFPIVYMYENDGYIVDVVFRKRADYKVTEPMIVGKILEHGIQTAEFEANNGGDFYARDIDEAVSSQGHRCNITQKRSPSTMAKMVRIVQFAPDIKNLYFKDKSLYEPRSDYGHFMRNLTTFVETGSSENDDGPDSLAGLCSMIKIPRWGSISTNSSVRRLI